MNLEANQGALDALLRSPHGPVAAELLRVGLATRLEAQRLLRGPGHGRVYTKRGRTHQASAPGEPPATDTGRLRASITHDEIPKVDFRGLVERVGSDLTQALALEKGTRNIAPRPFLRPALMAQKR